MQKHIKDWYEIHAEFNEVEKMSCKPSFNKMKSGTVIDEEMSVRWNREQVELNNKRYLEEVAKLNTAKNKARDQVYEDIYEKIMTDVGCGIKRDDAQKIWAYAYEKGHAYGFTSIQNQLDDVINLIRNILKNR